MQNHLFGWTRAAIASFAFMATAAHAMDGPTQCFNKAAETRCGAGQCVTATDGFTPAQLSLAPEAVELCAYSGCWQGRVSFMHTQDQFTYITATLLDTPHAQAPADVLNILYNSKGGYALANFADFALTMECAAH